MTVTRNAFFVLVALILFIVLAVYALVADPPDGTVLWGLLGSGLGAFAAGHL